MNYKCRFCDQELTNEILNLSHQPPSNAYIDFNNINKREITYPLRVYVCHSCWLAQLPAHASAEELFTSDYAYFSSVSSSWCRHAKEFVDLSISKLNLTEKSLVVEIASNDGYLLQYVKEKAIPCFGIEPTHAAAEAARFKGIDSIEEFFGASLAKQLIEKRTKKGADLIIGNNVLAHVPEINDFLLGIYILLNNNGVASLEFPHLLRLIKGNQFDTIYHEHYSYISLKTLKRIALKAGLNIFDVEEINTHGGSLRVWLSKDNRKENTENINKVISEENEMGLETLKAYQDFQQRAEKVKLELIEFLVSAKKRGDKVFGYGAAAKGNTLLNYAGIKSDLIVGVADKAKSKQGKYLPGSHIPIISPEKLFESEPDYIIIFPWNLIEELKNSFIGYKVVVAIPEFKIFEKR